MSFILDALKKSEADRQGNLSAGIADVPAATGPSSAPRWMWAVLVLLSINLLVLMVVLLKPDPVNNSVTDSSALSAVAAPGPAANPADTAQVAAEASPPPQVLQTPAQDRPDNPRLGQETAGTILETDVAPQLANEPVNEPIAEPTAAAPSPVSTETLLTFNDLRASGNVNLPDMHIDLHVYSNNPEERFVFINMSQYRENALLSEGPRLVNITPEGAVLEYSGTTFLLPRE